MFFSFEKINLVISGNHLFCEVVGGNGKLASSSE
jgi:hypothetical protein